MKKNTIKYTDHKISAGKIIPDFLPRPENLVLKEETVKVTLAINKDSIDFFKLLAKQNHTQYQKMIRNLLDHYVQFYKSEYLRDSKNSTTKR